MCSDSQMCSEPVSAQKSFMSPQQRELKAWLQRVTAFLPETGRQSSSTLHIPVPAKEMPPGRITEEGP